MNKPRNAALLFFVVLVSFLAGRWFTTPHAGETATADGRRILYYHDPMHPSYKSDKPGIAPDCGMQLEPVYADSGPSAQASRDDPASSTPDNVQISAEKKQLIGVRLAEVEKTSGNRVLRTLGRVVPDEDRIYRIVAGTEGWVRQLVPGGTTGSVVQKDQLLAMTYNRELLTAEQTFLYTTNLRDGNKPQRVDNLEPPVNAQMQSAKDNLRTLGMSDLQIGELAKSRKVSADLDIRAPVTGLIVARATFPGLRFDRGTELYRLVDLSHVWILADLFENETQHFRQGTTARVLLPHQHKTFTARVSDAPPQFDPSTRTLKVRLEAQNPGFALRPDMFVDVELQLNAPAAITVPADAVIDSGRRKVVYVERANAGFEPRLVETGWRLGDRVQITKGLEPGERIVVSGNFLIDSESRMNMPDGASPAQAEKAKPVKDLVCGMDVDPKSPHKLKTQYKGETYYFCSETCKKKFESSPEKYIPKKTMQAKADKAKDLVCGMEVDPKSPGTLKIQYNGATYYFCSERCKKSFEANPEKYVHKMADPDMPGMQMTE